MHSLSSFKLCLWCVVVRHARFGFGSVQQRINYETCFEAQYDVGDHLLDLFDCAIWCYKTRHGNSVGVRF